MHNFPPPALCALLIHFLPPSCIPPSNIIWRIADFVPSRRPDAMARYDHSACINQSTSIEAINQSTSTKASVSAQRASNDDARCRRKSACRFAYATQPCLKMSPRDVKAEFKGAKRSTHFLDDNDINDGDEEMDAEVIARGIDDLPVICHRFAQLVKQKTRFVVSFMFAGPDPRNDWDMTTLSCHPSETPKGKSFHELYETADRAFLEAFQQYAELIFPANKRKPDAITTNGDDNCAKKSEEGDEGEPEEDDGQLVEEDSQQGKETQLCEFEGGRAGTGMGSSDNGDASAGPATAFLFHPRTTRGAVVMCMTELPYNMHPPLGYDIQANTTYGTQAHLAYNTAAHPTYNSDSQAQYHTHAHAHAVLPHIDASFQSQGSSLPMQTDNYPGFSMPPSDSFTQTVITPNFSFAEGLRHPNWNFNDLGSPTPQSGWRLSDILSPTPAERSSLDAEVNDDSLPTMLPPVPTQTNGDSLPILPSPVDFLPVPPLPAVPSLVPAPGMDGTSRPSIMKASGKPKHANKRPNAKSATNCTVSKPSAAANTITQSALPCPP
ncbi:hypothetical protein EDB19DRAFT_1914513 [Suillus lakei]|nr:hypothetical protein EDB19DRAFT_1914513 [Suillus lakei]